jgi:hypothetical protein
MNELLTTAIIDLGVVDDRVFPAGSLGFRDIPTNPDFPYILIMEMQPRIFREVQNTARSKRWNFRITVCDEPGSFVRIDDILRQVRETVLGLTLEVSPSGRRCTQADWTGESGDLPDSEKKQNMKYGLASLVSNDE